MKPLIITKDLTSISETSLFINKTVKVHSVEGKMTCFSYAKHAPSRLKEFIFRLHIYSQSRLADSLLLRRKLLR